MPNELETKLLQLAEEYVKNEYLPEGEMAFAWEEWGDEEDDTTARTVSGYAPPGDCDDYSYTQVVSNEILSSELTSRNDETEEYCVTVVANIAIASGSSDDEDEEPEENIEPEERTIYVYIQRYADGDFGVEDAEE